MQRLQIRHTTRCGFPQGYETIVDDRMTTDFSFPSVLLHSNKTYDQDADSSIVYG